MKNTRRSYKEYLQRKHLEYNNFDTSKLAEKFIPFYESQERIEVKFSYGEIKRGTVSVTSGWAPIFILMLTYRSYSSVYILNNDDEIVKVVKKK